MSDKARHTAVLCLGSNMRPRRRRIADAQAALGASADVVGESPALESPDITGRSSCYINKVVTVHTDLDIETLGARIAAIEAIGGRVPGSPIVAVDIDIVMWDGRIVSPDDYARSYFQTLLHTL